MIFIIPATYFCFWNIQPDITKWNVIRNLKGCKLQLLSNDHNHIIHGKVIKIRKKKHKNKQMPTNKNILKTTISRVWWKLQPWIQLVITTQMKNIQHKILSPPLWYILENWLLESIKYENYSIKGRLNLEMREKLIDQIILPP